jgi:hypothetical protein
LYCEKTKSENGNFGGEEKANDEIRMTNDEKSAGAAISKRRAETGD